MDKSTLEKILNIAVQAPSGDNTQPWRFAFSGGRLTVFAASEHDNPIFNYRNIPTLIAIGALLENIETASLNCGHKAQITLSEKVTSNTLVSGDLVASITFSETTSTYDITSDDIKNRHTNRNAYKNKEIDQEIKEAISNLAPFGEVKVAQIYSKEKIQQIASRVNESERTVLTYKPLHDTFFDSIRWSPPKNDHTRGLDVRTLELVPPARLIFGLYKNWGTAKILNKLGFANIVATENAKTYATSSGYFFFALGRMSQAGAIHVGRTMQKYWIFLNRNGLAVQLTTGLSFLYPQIGATDGKLRDLPEVQKQQISKAFMQLLELGGLPQETEFVLFMRTGYPKKAASAHSLKDKVVLE